MLEVLENIGIVLVFALIIFLCYYTTKFLGKKLSGNAKNKSMNIVETLPLGLDRCLYLIKVGRKHFLFYSCKKSMDLVSEIILEDETDDSEGSENTFSFNKLFNDYSGLSKREFRQNTTDDTENEPDSGIIKSLKRLQKINGRNK